MIKKHTTIKFILSIFSAILIIFVFIFFLRIIKIKNKNISTTLSSFEEKIKTIEKNKLFYEKSTEIKSLQNYIYEYFIDTRKIDTFVSYLESLGEDLGSIVKVKEIKAKEKAKETIEFQLSITGDFDQVTKTIITLENIPYQIDVTRVYYNKETTIEKDEDIKIPQSSIWQADITFNTLSLN